MAEERLTPEAEAALCARFQGRLALAARQEQQARQAFEQAQRLEQQQAAQQQAQQHARQQQQQQQQQGAWHGRPVEATATHYAVESFSCRFESAMRLDGGGAEDPAQDLPLDPDAFSGSYDAVAAEDAEFHEEHGSELCFMLNSFQMDAARGGGGSAGGAYLPYIC